MVFANEILFIAALKKAGVSTDIKRIKTVIIAHENDTLSAEKTVGARAVGSTLDRFVNLQEAEAGGSDLTTMHAHVDTNTEVEWYSESGTSGVFFYPVGAWLLSP